MNFYEFTDRLLSCFTLAEIADHLGVNPQNVKQARLDPSKPGHRPPPAGWEPKLRELARQRSLELADLAES